MVSYTTLLLYTVTFKRNTVIPALNIFILLQIRGLDLLFLFLFGGCEDEMIQSVLHTKQTNKKK